MQTVGFTVVASLLGSWMDNHTLTLCKNLSLSGGANGGFDALSKELCVLVLSRQCLSLLFLRI